MSPAHGGSCQSRTIAPCSRRTQADEYEGYDDEGEEEPIAMHTRSHGGRGGYQGARGGRGDPGMASPGPDYRTPPHTGADIVVNWAPPTLCN